MKNDFEKNLNIEEMTEVVRILKPLSSEDRIRVVSAAFSILGEDLPNLTSKSAILKVDEIEGGDLGDLPLRARTWMNQNGVTSVELQQVFHLSAGDVEVIAAVPGKNKKEQTYNAYVLTGIGQLLLTGNAAFTDKAARALCESSGCYDNANHSATIRDRGNEFTGSKDKGWTLTAPGLKRAAELVKEINKHGA